MARIIAGPATQKVEACGDEHSIRKNCGFGPNLRAFDLLMPCSVIPPQQQILAREHASHLFHGVLSSKKTSMRQQLPTQTFLRTLEN